MSLTEGSAQRDARVAAIGRSAATSRRYTRGIEGPGRGRAGSLRSLQRGGLAFAPTIAAFLGGCLYPATVPPARIATTRPVPAPAVVVPDRPAEREVAPFDPAWEPESAPRDWKYLVLHHTAADAGSVESIDRVHRQRKDASGNNWLGIGYHFVIGNGHGMGDGEIEPTFRWKKQMHGAHAGVAEYNQHGIGIALIGNFEERDPTPAQIRALERLLIALARRFRIQPENIVGHSDIKSTACPGARFPLEEIRERVRAAM